MDISAMLEVQVDEVKEVDSKENGRIIKKLRRVSPII